MESKKRVIVQWTTPGFHNWPEASGARSYLAQRHRHLFHFRVEAQVLEARSLEGLNSRQVEFHDLLQEAQSCLGDIAIAPIGDSPLEFGESSCEMIAQRLLDFMRKWSPQSRVMACEVWEDGECGARVEYDSIAPPAEEGPAEGSVVLRALTQADLENFVDFKDDVPF